MNTRCDRGAAPDGGNEFPADRPSWAVTEKARSWTRRVSDRSNGQWTRTRPATTIAGDPRVGRPGHKDRAGGEAQFEQDSVKITLSEALVLQGFLADLPIQGCMTSQFRQVGNAIPPPMARAILAELSGRP